MAQNFPTIIFWDPKQWEVRDSALSYFQLLESVGIFHESPESAAGQRLAVWHDVEGWWQSEAVQSVRRTFCDRYAKTPEDVIKKLEATIRSVGEAGRAE
jgi:putative transferase (TIGR04331 family)